MAESARDEGKKTRSPWPYAVVGSLVLLALFDSVIVKLALETQTGVVETKPYEASLSYEQIIQAKRAAIEDGLTLHLAPQGGELVATLQGGPEEGTHRGELRVRLLRPDDPALDQEVSFTSTSSLFKGGVTPLKPGLWVVHATLTLTALDPTQQARTYRFESKEMF